MGEISTETNVAVGGTPPTPSPGHAGLDTQLPGQPTTVSTVAGATGGIAGGNLIESYVDRQLFEFESDDTPLMQLMLMAKRVKVNSPVIEHFAIDEPRASVVTNAAVGDGTSQQAILPLAVTDKQLINPYTTLLVKGVDGYTADGSAKTPGRDLMLLVSGRDAATGNPIARAVNGPKSDPNDELCLVPEIPAGTTLIILANAMYETQMHVQPDLVVPQPTKLYAQKRGMNNVVSDYFEHTAKRIPFGKALIAETQIRNFKVKGNRTLWSSRPGMLTVDTDLGQQTIYTTEGVRWQIKRHLDHSGKWTYEQLIALAKMTFTGDDVPKNVVILAGKNFIENIQCIDFSKHPEVQIISKTNPVGWKVTAIHTVFGEFEIKHDATLDRLYWSNSAAVIAYDRLIHYVYSQEHKKNKNIEGHEAKREATLVWDALGLKGSAHIWIDGEGKCAEAGATAYVMWDDAEAPETPVAGKVYVLLNDCPGISATAVSGTMWQNDGEGWKEFSGQLVA